MKIKFPRFVPEGSVKQETPAELSVEIYFYDRAPYSVALGYFGKSDKPAFHYRFKTPAQRDAYVSDWIGKKIESARRVSAFKAERAAEKKNFRHTLKVGDVLYSSWGYDQTNVEFYQIVSVTDKQVSFREIKQDRVRDGHDGGLTAPVKGDFVGDEVYKRTVGVGNRVSFSASGCGYRRGLNILDRPSVTWSDGH